MMLLELIIILNLKIIFTEKPQIDCLTKQIVYGCFTDNKIYINYKAKDVNQTLYHEIGHALFLKDDYSRTIIKNYVKKYHYEKFYFTEFNILNESVADYFAEFMMNNKEFSVKYPVLWIYFNDKIKNLL